jgi:hypothetical protein
MTKDRQTKSDKTRDGARTRTVMTLKPVEKQKSGSTVTSESWLTSLAKLAARMAEPPRQTKSHPA